METSIAESFKDGTVFVTGSTGFLGKILTEKLLRSCSLKKIALLVRSKKGFDSSQRVAGIYNESMFDRLRVEKPDFMNKIKMIDGDLEQPSLGLSPKDRDWLIENVNFVFHCAATIKFNENLQIATRINIQGTDNILTLATMMKNLKGLVHVSTAYSHCPRNVIKEEFYPTPITAKELKNMSKDEISCPNILNNWPNTYTFTKAIAENLMSSNDNQLPISIFRPSIIGCTKLEPNPGWLDNINGPSGIVTGVIAGFLRTIQLDKNKMADIIPVDYTVNALISVMWDTVNRHRHSNQMNKVPKIYNYVSSVESPLTWGKYIKEMQENYFDIPPLRSIWYMFYISHTNSLVSTILRFWLHTIPAAFVDLLLIISGQSPKMLKTYSKIEIALDLLREFTTRQWSFDNKNTVDLWLSLSKEDQKTFWFSFEDFDWKTYIKIYYLGIRKHILHEDLSNIEKAVTKNRKLFWLHNLCIVFIIYLLLQFLYWMFII
ncbi:fatty acyl-CoA reductase wat [Acyrthosiphon pisum]|uniref:Fatty acyl-CoA reductase n=1 Tax=Acyrthosiphon pisum TaxID=7029 RepID=A0A8R2A397_ACYPI|nr:fatty acyl-CoA reductase wat [Acyrthosiphon pisum]|eukprot:XP_001946150.2 PREDICTED: fatty acyl-CoA reductase 1 [Acyrthosiphon pisum]